MKKEVTDAERVAEYAVKSKSSPWFALSRTSILIFNLLAVVALILMILPQTPKLIFIVAFFWVFAAFSNNLHYRFFGPMSREISRLNGELEHLRKNAKGGSGDA